MTREEVISKIKEKCDSINEIAEYQLAYGEVREIQENLNEILEIVKTAVSEREKTMKLSEVYKLLGADMRGKDE